MVTMNTLARAWQRHPVVSYSIARIALFLVVFGVAVLVGVNTFWSLVISLVASMVASFFLLSKQRDAISASVVARSERARARMAERTAAEDAWDDARRAEDEASDGVDPAGTGGSPDGERQPE